jgi:hypothetical protein
MPVPPPVTIAARSLNRSDRNDILDPSAKIIAAAYARCAAFVHDRTIS